MLANKRCPGKEESEAQVVLRDVALPTRRCLLLRSERPIFATFLLLAADPAFLLLSAWDEDLADALEQELQEPVVFDFHVRFQSKNLAAACGPITFLSYEITRSFFLSKVAKD
jgi:hypothetical protein